MEFTCGCKSSWSTEDTFLQSVSDNSVMWLFIIPGQSLMSVESLRINNRCGLEYMYMTL